VKKHLLACSGVFILAVAACAQTGTDTTGTGGSGNTTGMAGTSGQAGTSGNAGTSGEAGTSGIAGTSGNAGTSGEAGTSGNAGTSGSAGRGGTVGNAGMGGSSVAGSGGAAGRGGTTGMAGTMGAAGRGGTTGMAGTTGAAGRGGTTGTAGTTGSGGTGGAACPTIDQLIPGFDGYLWQVQPSGNTALSGTNYPFGSPAGGCPSTASWDTTGYIKTETPLAIKGETGKKYTININVRGVVGTRCYTGGTPGSTAAGNPNGQNNTWYAGGAQYNNSIWNTMELRVTPKVTGAPMQTMTSQDIYFLNSFQNTSDWCQKEATYETRFNASFPVMGGGMIVPAVHDSNCRTLANCGSVEAQMSCNTAASRIIDMTGVSPAPMNFTQPRQGSLNGTTYQIQWVWIDVTSVTCN